MALMGVQPTFNAGGLMDTNLASSDSGQIPYVPLAKISKIKAGVVVLVGLAVVFALAKVVK
jgi:hypothetical protein